MKRTAMILMASFMLAAPAFAQWGSDYNMGSLGISGGDETNGSVVIDCAIDGNPVVPQGSLSIFVKPMPDSVLADNVSPGALSFAVDGTEVALPVGDNAGDGFVYDKTPETLADATELIDLIKGGKVLTVLSGEAKVGEIDLAGATDALDGIEACLTP